MEAISLRIRKKYICADLDYILNDKLGDCGFITPDYVIAKYEEFIGKDLTEKLVECDLVFLDLVEHEFGDDFFVLEHLPLDFYAKITSISKD
uniref:Uncharacterized protein n=1 Tax=Ditylenchus dipsaci TaxID=166011 RepID=A0A915ETU7_9BILA